LIIGKGVEKGSEMTIDMFMRARERWLMPRKLRVEYEGAIYHIMNRGDRREPIFVDDEDRQLFLETLRQACGKTDWQVHAYCFDGQSFSFSG